MDKYEVMHTKGQVPVKSWTRGVSFDENAKQQVNNMASMPFIHKWIAVMPDVHLGKGATIGSVIPTIGAVIPAAVGVDLGCGMMAAKTTLNASQLPDSLTALRNEIEKKVPHGSSPTMRKMRDKGSWANTPQDVMNAWSPLSEGFAKLVEKHPFLKCLFLRNRSSVPVLRPFHLTKRRNVLIIDSCCCAVRSGAAGVSTAQREWL